MNLKKQSELRKKLDKRKSLAKEHNRLLLKWQLSKKESQHQIECANALVLRIDDLQVQISDLNKELSNFM